jgi:hypothetical protein
MSLLSAVTFRFSVAGFRPADDSQRESTGDGNVDPFGVNVGQSPTNPKAIAGFIFDCLSKRL